MLDFLFSIVPQMFLDTVENATEMADAFKSCFPASRLSQKCMSTSHKQPNSIHQKTSDWPCWIGHRRYRVPPALAFLWLELWRCCVSLFAMLASCLAEGHPSSCECLSPQDLKRILRQHCPGLCILKVCPWKTLSSCGMRCSAWSFF